MSYTCPRCQRPLRRDQSLRAYQFLDGGYNACERCIAEAEGREPEPAKVYPPGCRMPSEPGRPDAPLAICGVCRRALYWGDQTHHIRIAEEDIREAIGSKDPAYSAMLRPLYQADLEIEPGGYAACRECTALFAPLIRERLVRDGKNPPPLEAMGPGSAWLS